MRVAVVGLGYGGSEDLPEKSHLLLEDPDRRRCTGAYNRRRFPLERMAWEHSTGELPRVYEKSCGPKRSP